MSMINHARHITNKSVTLSNMNMLRSARMRCYPIICTTTHDSMMIHHQARRAGRLNYIDNRVRLFGANTTNTKHKHTPKNNNKNNSEGVSEGDRIRYKKMMLQFQENDKTDKLELSTNLTNTERKFLHKLCLQLGLSSKSKGKGTNRRITVRKSIQSAPPPPSSDDGKIIVSRWDDYLPKLTIGIDGTKELTRYIESFPPTSVEEAQLNQMKSSLLPSFSKNNANIDGDGTGNNRNNHVLEPSQEQLNIISTGNDTVKPPRPHGRVRQVSPEQRAARHHSAQQAKLKQSNYGTMQGLRRKLPAHAYREQICDIIQNHRVTILSGDTGCGKSTQVPQFLLDDPSIGPKCNIVVTQPRRISATSIAERVAAERCERVGDTVGYSVRLDSASSNATQLMFVTPGILLRKFQSDPNLDEFTHIIIDEIHERDKHTEFFMIALRNLLNKRNDLHVILMSATLQTDELMAYWSGVGNGSDDSESEDGDEAASIVQQQEIICHKPAEIHIPGRTFPVEEFFLEDVLSKTNFMNDKMKALLKQSQKDANNSNHMMKKKNKKKQQKKKNATDVGVADEISILTETELLDCYHKTHNDDEIDNELLTDVIKYIHKSSYGDGAILVFLPGWQEISEMTNMLNDTPSFHDNSKFLVLPLHSGVPSREQKKVFQRPAQGVRKIILSTNIAETSVTIDDVAFVVDTGRAKEKNYNPHLKSSTLQPVWVSQASAKQRKGRAGRTKPGVCFYLFSRTRHASFSPFLESELLRTSLEEICLQCKKLDLAPGGPDENDGISAFLAAAMSPPHPKAVSNAIELLVDLGAMEPGTDELTDLGQCLSTLSLEPRVGKMVIWSYILGCARAASSMAVAMSHKSPFTLPSPLMRQRANKARVEISEGSESDQVTALNVLKARDLLTNRRGRRNGLYDYCQSNFINVATINMISELRRNIARELTGLGFPDPSRNGWHNCNDGGANLSYLQATIVAGLYPNIATRCSGETNFRTLSIKKCRVHQSSVNSIKGQPLRTKCAVDDGELEFVAYGEMVRGMSSFTINQTTHLASAIPLILLCGEFNIRPAFLDCVESNEVVLSVDDGIMFRCDRNEASALAILRKRLDSAFLRIVSNPTQGQDALNNQEQNAVRVLNVMIKSAFNDSPERWRE